MLIDLIKKAMQNCEAGAQLYSHALGHAYRRDPAAPGNTAACVAPGAFTKPDRQQSVGVRPHYRRQER
jgi:hypothetical protein